ncbi:hypothetical protein Nepgr_002376 [Nepenthes gracilis]|uniref:C2 domain-containing protein n=1 Tax=Nepenthes gracilis TaxID=150966 RepID=A0AAD3P6X6_NEPGR|nr:hypothetical protein Nepgr_002376 [Nepenthes gracilis]
METTAFPFPSTYALEITVTSAEGLRVGRKRRPVKKNAFVTVQTDLYTYQSTKVDTEGGSNPAWNERFVICMPMHAKFITLEVQCKAHFPTRSNEAIGAARVPVSDFIGGYAPSDYLQFLSYGLRNKHGDRSGIINFSVTVKGLADRRCVPSPWPVTPALGEKGFNAAVVTCVPAAWFDYNVRTAYFATNRTASLI